MNVLDTLRTAEYDPELRYLEIVISTAADPRVPSSSRLVNSCFFSSSVYLRCEIGASFCVKLMVLRGGVSITDR